MLYPVSVLVPTLYGRTRALLYDVASSPLGAVLVEPQAIGHASLEPIYDEVSLYLRSAGASVLRLTSAPGLDATHYAANIVGSVALLHKSGASRVVLIAATHKGAFPWDAVRDGAETDDGDITDHAFEGFLDLVTARATTPAEYSQLITELVDTIREVIDTVVGVVHLAPAAPAYTSAYAQAVGAERGNTLERETATAPHGAAGMSLAVSAANSPQHDHAADYIAQLYTGAMYLLRERETMRPTARVGASLDVRTMAQRKRFSERIWSALDRVWRQIVMELNDRQPHLAPQFAALERRVEEGEGRSRVYGQAWALFDSRARLDWLAACAKAFPVRPELLPPPPTIRPQPASHELVVRHSLQAHGAG